ncbi:hypothetical protein NEIELOOT_01400 [Neisseria elongata subsp. glycolytica ATCC 29315]|uniref:Uncharacterized protein n=1 Tax=Neisseria elongata subsp. glycolytica ATCC 29315 TaxID=546263 RepID=D4DQR0_NEIEG|nr:hypothetical protein NEIELOOT_01400 [Neisseria elongata subsp. glycolytica ATCC 29315]
MNPFGWLGFQTAFGYFGPSAAALYRKPPLRRIFRRPDAVWATIRGFPHLSAS